MAQRSIVVTYETIRQWCLKCGQTYANELRHRRPGYSDTWYMDEVVLTIRGKKHYLWRAVDQDGNVLDILVQSRRKKKAAKRFFRKLLKGLQYVSRVIITDKLKSYAAAPREILPGWSIVSTNDSTIEQKTHINQHDCEKRTCGNSNQQSMHNAFSLLIAPISGHFQPRRHRMNAREYRAILRGRFHIWNEVTGAKLIA